MKTFSAVLVAAFLSFAPYAYSECKCGHHEKGAKCECGEKCGCKDHKECDGKTCEAKKHKHSANHK